MPSLFGSGQSKQQKALTDAQTNVVNFGLGQAESTIPKATGALTDSLSFFKQLLTGNRGAIESAIGPQLKTLTSQYETASRVSNEFNPRGGGATAAAEESRFQEAGDITTLVQQAQQEGATGEASIGQMLANLGLGELGVSSSTAANTASQLETSKENQQAQQAAAGQAAGALLALLVGL